MQWALAISELSFNYCTILKLYYIQLSVSFKINFILTTHTMTTQERQTKVADMIKNADLYDLIRISMRSSDTKVSAVDRYIKRALDR